MSNKISDETPPQELARLRCGLIMPIAAIDGCSEGHWEEVRNIIKEALADTNFDVELVSDSNEIGIIQNRIVTNIYKSDMVICDVSGKNPNVMFELGMRLAFDKPTLIIKDDNTNYSFDTAPIEHISYPRDLRYQSVLLFKETLRTKLLATHKASLNPNYTTFLKHFGDFRVAEVSERTVTSDAYILETLDKLSVSVNQLQNTVNRPADYSVSSASQKELIFRSLTEATAFDNYLTIYWRNYKGQYNLSNNMLGDENLRRDAALYILSNVRGRYPFSESILLEKINSFLFDLYLRAESNL